MTTQKWLDNFNKEVRIYDSKFQSVVVPADWAKLKTNLTDLIKNIDESVEAYNLENKVK